MMSGMEFDSLFDNAVAHATQKAHEEAGMDMFAVHRLTVSSSRSTSTPLSQGAYAGRLLTWQLGTACGSATTRY